MMGKRKQLKGKCSRSGDFSDSSDDPGSPQLPSTSARKKFKEKDESASERESQTIRLPKKTMREKEVSIIRKTDEHKRNGQISRNNENIGNNFEQKIDLASYEEPKLNEIVPDTVVTINSDEIESEKREAPILNILVQEKIHVRNIDTPIRGGNEEATEEIKSEECEGSISKDGTTEEEPDLGKQEIENSDDQLSMPHVSTEEKDFDSHETQDSEEKKTTTSVDTDLDKQKNTGLTELNTEYVENQEERVTDEAKYVDKVDECEAIGKEVEEKDFDSHETQDSEEKKTTTSVDTDLDKQKNTGLTELNTEYVENQEERVTDEAKYVDKVDECEAIGKEVEEPATAKSGPKKNGENSKRIRENSSNKTLETHASDENQFVAASNRKSKNKKQKKQRIENEVSIDESTVNTWRKFSRDEIYGRGIEGAHNSCFLDSTLFSMFYYTNIFDGRFLRGEHAKESRDNDYNAEEITSILNNVVWDLRSGYCSTNSTATLRYRMSYINERLISSMMDVDEFISNLFGRALQLEPFINYSVGTSNYLHQILIHPSKPRPSQIGTVQKCLIESMQIQGLKLACVPNPAMIIKMPRSNGALVGFNYILPNITLDVSEIMKKEPKQKALMHLIAVIVLRYHHYTAYVRCGTEPNSSWAYFNSMPANVRSAKKIHGMLQIMENDDGQFIPSELRQIMGDIHVCIYEPHT